MNKERDKKYRDVESRKEAKRGCHLKAKYGLTIFDYNQMFSTQEGRCDLCEIHQSELKSKLCVDHNHSTGKVRSLLCHNCNSAIGYLKENPILFERAIEYLNTHNTKELSNIELIKKHLV